jgi:hypothetical protein
MNASMDPNVPHPGMLFVAGKWRTPEGVERWHLQQRRWNETYRATVHGHTTEVIGVLRRRIGTNELRLVAEQQQLDGLTAQLDRHEWR